MCIARSTGAPVRVPGRKKTGYERLRSGPAAPGLLPFARGSQSAVEEFGSGAVGADPIVRAEQIVNFVRDN